MAKKSFSVCFSNATLTVEDGKYVITEIEKDDSIDYDLSKILNDLDGSSNLFISIILEDMVDPISEE